MKKKKWKMIRGAAVVCIVIASVILLNILASAVVDKYSWKLDTTSSGLYQMSQESIDLLRTLDQPVEVYCISKGRDSIKEFSELLDKYAGANELVYVTYVDPYANPTFLDQLASEGEDVGINTIIVESGGRRRVFSMADMYTFSADGSQLVYFDAEAKLTSAILNVASGDAARIGVLMGHGENMPEAFQNLAMQNNFDISGVVLNKPVPDDCDILLALAPQSDFSQEETGYLEAFLVQGGCLALFSDPTVKELPNMDALLEKWGIVFNDDVVFDAASNIESNPVNVVTYYTEHPITEYFRSNQYYTVAPAARSMALAEAQGKTLEAVLATSDDAYARDIDTTEKTTQKLASDQPGPFLLAATSSQEITLEDGAKATARIFAMGSKRVYSDEMLTLTSVGNAKFMVNLLRWCNDNTGTAVSIPPRQVGGAEMTVLPGTAYVLGIVFTAVIPAAILVFGLRIFLRRKHL